MKPIILLIISTLLITACNANLTPQPHPVQSIICNDYQPQVERALREKDLKRLKFLLRELKKTDCSNNYLNGIKTQLSEMTVEKAKMLVQNGEVGQAEDLLKNYSDFSKWQTREVLGDVAAKRKQWKQATESYHSALRLIEDDANPLEQDIHRVYKLAKETQMLSGELLFNPDEPSRGGASSMKTKIRGVKIKEHPIPIEFHFDKTTFTERGKTNAYKLAKYLEQERPNNIILVGHTDPEGDELYNCELSKKRAQALKNYLINYGFHADLITALGKGEWELPNIYDPSRYSLEELHQIYRRVEFAINEGIPRTNVCPAIL